VRAAEFSCGARTYPRARRFFDAEIHRSPDSVAVPELNVGQAMPFFWQRQERFAEQSEVVDPHGEFAGLGAE